MELEEICEVCIMDSSCQPISFFGSLGCSYCIAARERASYKSLSQGSIEDLASDIRHRARRESKYDCVVGVSGGLDSTYLIVRLKQLGLRPLAVHMDNNWNSSMASGNLRRVLESEEIDLVTYVTPWEIQKKWQKALLSADVVDVELLYDNLLHAVCYQTAKNHGIRTILGGANTATEGVEVPVSWLWFKFDGRNLRSIAWKFGLDSRMVPVFSYTRWLVYTLIHRIRWVSALDWMPEYSRATAETYLSNEYGYVSYGNKHYENVFTRFYQAEILPRKFGFDKRKPHLSSEIVAGAITREEAMELLKYPTYSSHALARLDKSYVLAKLGLTGEEFEAYISRPGVPHSNYAIDKVGWVIRLIIKARDSLKSPRASSLK